MNKSVVDASGVASAAACL